MDTPHDASDPAASDLAAAGPARAETMLLPFARHMFAGGASDDLAPYGPRALADLAELALDYMRQRAPGERKVRLYDASGDSPESALRAVSILEAVNDDRPFLVDSIAALLAERGHDINLLLHPIYAVERDDGGRLVGFPDGGERRESLIHIHLPRIEDEEARRELVEAVIAVLEQVAAATDDWRAMRARLDEAVARYREAPLPAEELDEAIAFLEWLRDDNFTFLGVREFTYDADLNPRMTDEIGLGILSDPEVKVLRRGNELTTSSPAVRAFLAEPSPLFVTKANVRSAVHRRSYMDYVGVKRFEDDTLVGELRLVGLFTSSAYTRSVRYIPYLRRKVDTVLGKAGFAPNSHSGKALMNVLETYPRDELFQISAEELTPFAIAAMQLEERPRVRVLPRVDKFERYASVLVYVPRERFASDVRERIGDYLAEGFGGHVSAFYPQFLEGRMVRVHFIIGGLAAGAGRPGQAALEAGVRDIVTTWADRLSQALKGHADGAGLAARYANAFSAAYQHANGPEAAILDIAKAQTLDGPSDIAIDLHRTDAMAYGEVGLKIFHLDDPVPLSSRLPMLENMGLTAIAERTFELRRPDGDRPVWLHDILLKTETPIDLDTSKDRLEDMFLAAWDDRAVSDGFNALGLAGLAWREVALLRTLARYMAQGGSAFGLDYAAGVLGTHAEITRALFDLFTTRHDPAFAGDREASQAELVARINAGLADVTSIGEDQVLRRYREVIEASQRTNYFQRDEAGEPHAEIVVKIASPQLTWLPQPRPFVEAYLHAPSVEAVHLRGGKVARGGIRWSDRPQDFRTEVLGLAKAQQVKNAVIVPVGAKGGFVPRDADRSLGREAFQEAGITAYKRFVTRMLGITDNLDGDTVVPPENVVRHDGDDPYFVVAADKGTATFSDTANAISQAHGYWLDDAFASGGSAGYDHKAMGITARGGWESVKRHFAEADIDLDKPFTVVGVGDMSGDVFGNGMIYVPTIKLLAAFDHRDIFIDPDPDPVTSFAERERLFAMGRSSWKDYDESLISAGGGIFSRELKAIPLSDEMRALLDLEGESATPAEVMSAILKARADLLWFGGIGTYIRAGSESDGDVGDRANDAIRITGAQVRARVIGEGANLGLTQLGRIEAATDDREAGGEPGVRLNTDAIDNSGGVNSSDLEVNIKIGLQTPEREGRLTREDRNTLLKEMTEEVAALVLSNNARQALAISLVRRRAVSAWGDMARVMQKLEARDLLKREVEFLPSDSVIAERVKADVPVSRPEIAVILAYAKIALYDDLIASPVPDDPYLSRELQRYFPTAMQERFPEAIETHRLRREIIATMLANSIINRGGPALITQMADRTGASASDVAFAFALVRDAYGLQTLNGGIDALDTAIPGDLQIALYARVQDLLITEIAWFLRHGAGSAGAEGGLADKIARYEAGIAAYREALGEALDEDSLAAIRRTGADLAAQGVPDDLARMLAELPHMARATDVVLVADQAEVAVAKATRVYVEVGRHFHIDRLTEMAAALEPSEHYDRLAITRTRERLEEVQRRLTRAVLRNGEAASVATWAEDDRDAHRAREAVATIAAETTPTLAKVTVAAGFLADLAVSDA